jgi:trehalose synthase
MGPKKNLKDYRQIVGDEIIEEIYTKARRIADKHIVAISSTYQGGGVAEIMNSIVFLFNEIGIDFGWRILHGTTDFFSITKKFHNALQGEEIHLTEMKKKIYQETNRRFSLFTHLHHDLVIVHDPQPLPLIDFYPNKKQPWIFRCHVDLSKPNKKAWNYLKGFIEKYDHFVVSRDEYRQKLPIQQTIIRPATDPLSPKNEALSQDKIENYLDKFGIKQDKPLIAQVSRFDAWKDPEGVLEIFEKVRKKVDCRLALLGSLAPDDPEGQATYKRIEAKVSQSKYKSDIYLLLVDNDILVNCLQRFSDVIIQKSRKEGFGLTVTEALYKGTPVVASRVGGIPLQVVNDFNGYLHEPDDVEGFSESVIKILKDKKLRQKLGKNGRKHVINNFLITRLMNDWLDLFENYLN